ncbi:hypothetical protein SscP1EGY_43 [Streptomyces phage SscP1EGY]|nr:hypothetical protein SscP1EGY_43 [Streptomyces phage SscP1EGY]
MKIELKRPSSDYPLVYVHIPANHNAFDLAYVLNQNRITVLGQWEADGEGGYKAPALLEDEHVKPKKKPGLRSKK